MSKQLVLMVDDELDNRVMMRYFLESWGYDVDLAENGQEALDKVDEKRPALILLDLEMPVLNGFETCERLKENPDTEDILDHHVHGTRGDLGQSQRNQRGRRRLRREDRRSRGNPGAYRDGPPAGQTLRAKSQEEGTARQDQHHHHHHRYQWEWE